MSEENDNKNEWILDLPLTKSGNSLVVSIPKKILNACNLGLGAKIRVTIRGAENDE